MRSHVRGSLLALALLASLAVGSVADEAAALLALPAATGNWGAATNGLGGAAWQAGTAPCGDGGAQAAWHGVTCTGGQVTAIQLSGLGLDGTLPAALAQLSALRTLDLSGNRFRGALPPAWLADAGFPSLAVARLGSNQLGGAELPANLLALASANISLAGNQFVGPLPANWSSGTLVDLDLSANGLTGTLPPSWGGKALPALSRLGLQGNKLRGLIPMPEWTDSAFAVPCVVDLRPGNEGMCGAVMPLNPDLYPPGHPERNQPLIPYSSVMRTGRNLTHIILTQQGLFTQGTDVTITNWLGSCMVPCSEVPNGLSKPPAAVADAGLLWPPSIVTNVYDVTWKYNMTIADLLVLNPNASYLRPGAALTVPCYPDNPFSRYGFYGGSVSFGKFTGGNQRLGSDGLPGAMAAARVSGNLPNTFHPPSVYTGSMFPGGQDSFQDVIQPVYMFVDMLAPFHVTNIIFTAGGEMRNTSVYVGSDATSVFANTLVASGINLAAGQKLPVSAGGTVGRYVIIYTGTLAEGTLILDDVQVYTYETNAAAWKAAAATGVANSSSAGGTASALALVDNDPSTCVTLTPDSSGAVSATVDLGYTATVGSIVVRAGPDSTSDVSLRAYVTASATGDVSDSQACSGEGMALRPGAWAVSACNNPGRYVTVRGTGADPATQAVQICELQASLAAAPSVAGTPSQGGGDGGDGGLSGGAIVGVVVGVLAGVALLTLIAMYLQWRGRWMAQQRRQLAVLAGLEEKEHPEMVGMQHYGDGDEEQGEGLGGPGGSNGGGSGGGGGGGGMAVSAGGVVVTGAGKAVAPEQAGWDKPLPARLNELQLLARFFASLRNGGPLASLSQHSSHESGSRRRDGFGVAKGGSAAEHSNAVTDLTKLPPGFLEVAASDIKLVECVGEGSFGEVWLAEYCGALVAVKILAKVKSDFMTHSMQQQLALRNLQKEALLMSKLRHPNVCLYLGAVANPPCLVMEYCAKCSLDHLLRAGLSSPQMAKRLSWVRLLSMALDAAKGMLYLHSRKPPVAHRDLKSANLLVDSQWRVKVADFSLSRALEIGSTAYTVVSTNPRWLAPEVLSGHPGQLPADVWAFGTVLWELCTWQLPFEDLNTFQIINKVQSQGSAGLEVPAAERLAAGPFSCYSQYVELMQACWAIDPAHRPTFAIIKEQLADMLTTEMVVQQAAAAAAAADAAGAHATADLAMLHQIQMQHLTRHPSTHNSGSSSGRGVSQGNSVSRGSFFGGSGRFGGSGSHSNRGSRGRDVGSGGSGGGGAPGAGAGSGSTPRYTVALPPGNRAYE